MKHRNKKRDHLKRIIRRGTIRKKIFVFIYYSGKQSNLKKKEITSKRGSRVKKNPNKSLLARLTVISNISVSNAKEIIDNFISLEKYMVG